jgi:hypothetical protein
MADEKATAPKDSRTTDQRIADLEAQLAASRAAQPLGTTPYHGAGPGTDTAETWSQAEQEAEHAADNAGA